MSLQRLANDRPVFVTNGILCQVQIHQAPVIRECPEKDSLLGIICSIMIWLEPGHTTVACQSVGDNLTDHRLNIALEGAFSDY
jgi:hypothetical protein